MMSTNTEPFHHYLTSELKYILEAYDLNARLLLFATKDTQTLVLSPAGLLKTKSGAATTADAAGLVSYNRADLIKVINARPDTDNVR